MEKFARGIIVNISVHSKITQATTMLAVLRRVYNSLEHLRCWNGPILSGCWSLFLYFHHKLTVPLQAISYLLMFRIESLLNFTQILLSVKAVLPIHYFKSLLVKLGLSVSNSLRLVNYLNILWLYRSIATRQKLVWKMESFFRAFGRISCIWLIHSPTATT